MRLQRLFLMPVVMSAAAGLCLAQPVCSQQSIHGTWVDLTQGTMYVPVPGVPQPMPMPAAGIVVFTIDHQGRFTARGPTSVAGQVARGEVTGAFQVNSDCTATATFTGKLDGTQLPNAGTEKLFIAGDEMRSLAVKPLMGKNVMLEKLRRMSSGEPQCNNQTVRGTYGGTWEGIVMLDVGQPQLVPAPATFVGVAAITPQGTVSGGYSVSIGGELMEVKLVNATVEVNPDCTGRMRYRVQPKGAPQPAAGQGIDEIVVMNNGDEIVGLTVQGFAGGPTVGLSTMKRLSMMTVTPEW